MATEQTLGHLADLGGFEITGLAARHSAPHDGADAARQRMPVGSTLRFHRLPRPLMYESWLRFGWSSVDRFRRDASVLWASSMIVPPTAGPVVATVHDLDFLDHTERLSRRGQGFFPRTWTTARARAQIFVCPSKVVAADCVRHGAQPDRVVVVPWGVGPPRCRAGEAAEVVAGLGLPERYILWVGPVEPRKNPLGAEAALDRLGANRPAGDQIDLVIVGARSGHDEMAGVFDRLTRRVHRLSPVDDRTLSALYHQASVLFYPSLAEGFGLPVLEAMAHGTPVVTSSTTATAEVAGGAALAVDPSDTAQLAEALEAALRDGETRRRLIENGHARAAQLSWDTTAKGYADVFRSVL